MAMMRRDSLLGAKRFPSDPSRRYWRTHRRDANMEKEYSAIPSKDIMPKLAKMFGVDNLLIRRMEILLDYRDICEVTVIFLADERALEDDHAD